MVCRSCGISWTSKVEKSKTKAVEPVIARVKAKGVVDTTSKKVSVPTRSPARTFKSLGED